MSGILSLRWAFAKDGRGEAKLEMLIKNESAGILEWVEVPVVVKGDEQ
jgi:hypothetical protein